MFGLSVFGWVYWSGITPNNMNNFIDVMSNLLSFSSMTTAVFMAVLVFVPKLSIGPLQVLGTDKKFLERILITTCLYFVLSVFALLAIMLFQDDAETLLSTIILGLLFGVFASALAESLYISIVLGKTIHL